MSNTLKSMEKDLRAFAKRSKDVKYTKGLLLSFLLMGAISFAETLTSPQVKSTENAINQTKRDLNTSISDMHKTFKQTKRQNNKLLRNANLELIQLMEQGDQVVKIPWNTWQWGTVYTYNDWRGEYKGKGDKKEKYPFNGMLERDADEMNRYIPLDSENRSLLRTAGNVNSASTNLRQGLSQEYGIASTRLVKENPITIQVNAGITPRSVNKADLNLVPNTIATPTLPTAISFSPVTPVINPPEVEEPQVTSITPPGTGNGDETWIDPSGGVAPLAQIGMSGGTMNVRANGNSFDVKTNNVAMTGIVGAGSSQTNHGIQNLNWTNLGQIATMKLVGGHRIPIDNITINYTGTGTSTRWLFHTDGHDDHGDSTWHTNGGTKINLDGDGLIMYTSQYHSGGHFNIGFLNEGQITTSATGKNNYIWMSLSESGDSNRVQYFRNTGTITLNGENDVFAQTETPVGLKGGYSIINEGTITLNGNKEKGIVSSPTHTGAEILLNNPIVINGNGGVGVSFFKWSQLDGGTEIDSNGAGNKQTTFLAKTRPSIIKLTLNGNNSTGIYVKTTDTNAFELGGTNAAAPSGNGLVEVKSVNGNNNTLVFVKDGKVNIKNAASKLDISGGKNNTAIYVKSDDAFSSVADINVTNSDNSVGIYANGTGGLTNSGKLSISGKSIKGIVADGAGVNVTNSGNVTFDGSATAGVDGSAAFVAQNGATLTSSGTNTVKVSGKESIALFADKGTLNVSNVGVTTTDKAFGVYSKGANGIVKIGAGSTFDIGQGSLGFYTTDGGKIEFTGNVTAKIKGGTAPDETNTRGNAFYFVGNGYSPFDQNAVNQWVQNTFNNSLNKLTLDMEAGSRLFVASDIAMNLTDVNIDNLFGANKPTMTGSNDYKRFMLYLSRLDINRAVNLDSSTEDYKQIEIANSSVTNHNTITGTQNGQTAIAQENGLDTSGVNGYASSVVTLLNDTDGTINLSGNGSTGIYAKRGTIVNKGNINVGQNSTGIYLLDDNAGPAAAKNDGKVENTGTINIGERSSGIYYTNTGTAPFGSVTEYIKNSGRIQSSANNVIGMAIDTSLNKNFINEAGGIIDLTGDKSTAMYATGDGTYTAKNNGTIKLANSSNQDSPNVGMFTDKATITLENNGNITAGNKTVGIYGYEVNLNNGSTINLGDGATGVYSKGGNVTLNSGSTINIGTGESAGVYYVGDGGTITANAGSVMNFADNSFGFVIKNNAGVTGNTLISQADATLGNKVVYAYSNDNRVTIHNQATLTATGSENYGIYSAGTVTNDGNMNFQTGIGNVGVYSINNGTATNNASITVGASDPATRRFAIGMAAGYQNSDFGKIVNSNTGVINVTGSNGIGMYATGNNGSSKSIAENHGTINIAGEGAMGMYLDEGAEGHNYGTIKTTGTQSGMIGVVLSNNSTLVNHAGAVIDINSPGGFGTYRVNTPYVKVVNYGTINVSGGATADGLYDPTGGQALDKSAGGVRLYAPTGSDTAQVTVNGTPVTNIESVNTTYGTRNALISTIGMYIDTLRGTNPINGLEALGVQKAELLIGPEAADKVNGKYIEVGENILAPYRTAMVGRRGIEWSINSSSLTWMALPILDGNGTPKKIYMAKIPYTAFAGNKATPVEKTDTYNFLDGMEQMYGVETGEHREKQLFNKLNRIGNNEEILLYQAIDEMMGHQYANIQHRINKTGVVLDREFSKLQKNWDTSSKKSNKIVTFGSRDEYNTDTAGIIDYKSNAYGVAYIHENETIKLGNSSGWYAGAVNNTFKFKDIGKSKENVTMVKAGVYNTKAFDNNGSLQWTISGEGFASRSAMERKYLVVDEIFKAKSDYNTYGVAVKNEISKEFRTGERFSIRPYGSLKLEYGKFGDIKEKSGEMRLEVKGNDYISVKPEVGMEFKYKRAVGRYGTFSTTLGLGYENELGKVDNVKNKARVANTNAEWFGIRSEKDDRKGNFKADLTVGIDNSKFGVTVNGGYDTKGKNVRGGIGFKFMY